MKLISFAAISLLAITVSAWPPNSLLLRIYRNLRILLPRQSRGSTAHNIQQQSYDSLIWDIQRQYQLSIAKSIHRSQNSMAQNIQQQSQDSTVQGIQQSQDDIERGIQQQPQDDTSQSIQYLLDYAARENFGVLSQDIQQQPQDDTSQSIQHLLDSTGRGTLQYQDDTAQNTLQYQDDIVQGIQKYHEDIAQDIQLQYQDYTSQGIQQPQDYTTQGIHHFLNYIAQDIQQYQGAIAPDIPQQSQDGATQSSQQSDRDKVQTEIDRLKLALDVQDHQFSQIDNYINTEKQKVTEIQAMIRKGIVKLQGISISMDERLKLEQNIYDLRMLADELTAKYRKQYHAYIDAMTECGTAKAELQLLRYNQKLIAEYNADHEVKVRISPNSFYNIDILKIQYADILKQIDKLLVEQKAMWESTRVFGGSVFRGQSEELENAIRALQIYSGVAREIVWQHKYGQSIGEWSARYDSLYLWNGQI
ncbi:hypothetical protein BASA50_000455 [Batrachochytrium salamandrivorans]|uniref:Uncharacterized protein n=1 Tax=Batrachochytrium salamandrivorans TaxID=1357716 RepID=A0ABQ8EWX2_9FUNG|nr:hypothetical protein BASA50_000455 [Batrachochytrium salamandrivorans]